MRQIPKKGDRRQQSEAFIGWLSTNRKLRPCRRVLLLRVSLSIPSTYPKEFENGEENGNDVQTFVVTQADKMNASTTFPP
jgi:hypothetical protein